MNTLHKRKNTYILDCLFAHKTTFVNKSKFAINLKLRHLKCQFVSKLNEKTFRKIRKTKNMIYDSFFILFFYLFELISCHINDS